MAYISIIEGYKTLMGDDGKPIDLGGTSWFGEMSPYNLKPSLYTDYTKLKLGPNHSSSQEKELQFNCLESRLI